MTDLFDAQLKENNPAWPLAERLRPRTLDQVVGQEHLVGEGKLLRKALEKDCLVSILFWGPPGSGKTTLARIIAQHTSSIFKTMSAVDSGIKDIKETVRHARDALRYHGKRTILFVDEIHRFNKAQQDAFLPHVEDGSIILIGATTENPSFELNAALLSRLKVLLVKPLESAHMDIIIQRVLDYYQAQDKCLVLDPDARKFLCTRTNGDARCCLNTMEAAISVLMAGDKS